MEVSRDETSGSFATLIQGRLPQSAGELGLEGERRRVTTVFADIVGFTPLAEAMDPEHARDLVNRCFERLVPAVNRYGGTVDKFLGDAVMALFGAPLAHENDPERALRSALAMREALDAFNREHDTRLGIHIGVNTGLVVAGAVGARGNMDYSVVGDAVNLASRLGDAAQPGEIMVGPTTYRLTHHLFDFEPVGRLRLKGKEESIATYRLLRARAPSPVETRAIRSPQVGREAEMALLVSALERLRAGKGGIISILGEAGLGKSRLVAEARRQSAAWHPIWLEGHALSFGQSISYWPFLEIIQSDAGMTSDELEGERWHKFERRLRGLFGAEATEVLPYLAALLALEVPGELSDRLKNLDSDTMGRQVFRAARRYFARLAAEGPLVLLFEDVHWMDESSMVLLEHLAPLVRELPILICGTGRPDPDAPAASLLRSAERDYADCYTPIRLDHLSTSQSDELIANLLGQTLPSRGAREEILRKAEGNPLFVEEIVQALIDLGGLVRDKATGRWQMARDIGQFSIPDTLQGLILARIDRLDENTKQVVRVAAVIGRRFPNGVLRCLAGNGTDVDAALYELERLQIIGEGRRGPEPEYVFKHALVQAAAYESTLIQRRRTLHGQVGECIERLYTDRLDEFYPILAYHFTLAQDWVKAQDYLFKAADRAVSVAADAEALAHYAQALEVHGRAYGDRLDSLQAAALERKMGEALFRRGQHEQAYERLYRALSALGSPYPQSIWGVRLAIGGAVLRQLAHRLLPRLFKRPPSPEVDRAAEACRIYWSLGWMDYFNDPERLLLDALLMWNLGEEQGLSAEVVHGSMTVGLVADAIPLAGPADRLHRQAVSLAERAVLPAAIGQAYLGLAIHEEHVLGRWDEAVAHFRESAAGYWEAGELRRWTAPNWVLAGLLAQRGEIAASLDLCREVSRVAEEAGDSQAAGWGLSWGGNALDRAGRLEEAAADLRRAIDVFKTVPDHQSTVGAEGFLARCYLRQGKLPEAMAVLEDSRRLIDRHHLKGFVCVPAWLSMAQASLVDAEQADGDGKSAALQRAKQACRAALAQSRIDRGSLAVAYRLQGTYEWLRGDHRRAHAWWGRGIDLAESLGARYELGSAHLEIGQRTKDIAHLEQAEAIFTAIGAQHDLVTARQLLGR